MNFSQDQILELLRTRPIEVGHWVGFSDLMDLHNSWLLEWLYGSGDITIQAHRGSYKTSSLSLFLALNCIIHPRETMLFIRKTDSDVEEVITQVGRILRTGAVIELTRALYGTPIQVTRDTLSEIETSYHRGVTGASHVRGYGIGASLTGKHADIVVTDDIVNARDRVSRAERERTKLAYQELQNVKNRTGRILNTGTPWHEADAFELMPNIHRYDCYSTGLMTDDEIQTLRRRMTPSLFAANYLLKHIAESDRLFTDASLTADVPIGGIAHIDAAYGGGDSTALTVLQRREDALLVYGKLYSGHVNAHMDEIVQLMTLLQVRSLYLETNGDKGYLQRDFTARGISTIGYHETMNKFLKISTHLKGCWDEIQFSEQTDGDYIDQILEYSMLAKHDDAPDSLASAIRALDKPQTTLNRGLRYGL